MRAIAALFILTTLGLGALAYTAFHITDGLAPLPLAGRGAVAAGAIGAALLFTLFMWLRRRRGR